LSRFFITHEPAIGVPLPYRRGFLEVKSSTRGGAKVLPIAPHLRDHMALEQAFAVPRDFGAQLSL